MEMILLPFLSPPSYASVSVDNIPKTDYENNIRTVWVGMGVVGFLSALTEMILVLVPQP